jgi:hypothetical protein
LHRVEWRPRHSSQPDYPQREHLSHCSTQEQLDRFTAMEALSPSNLELQPTFEVKIHFVKNEQMFAVERYNCMTTMLSYDLWMNVA